MRATVLMPAHNEAARIAASVTAARAIPGVTDVVVIDDGSTDATANLARDAGALVVTLPRNAGKGAALNAGLAHIDGDADALLLLDADLGDTAAEGAQLLEPIAADVADMVVGTLERPPGSGGFGLVKGLARSGIAHLGGGFRPEAPISGQRALSRTAWTQATPFAQGYGAEVALTVRALWAGLRVAEVPVAMRHATTGRDVAGFLHRGRQFLDILGTLVALRFENRRAGRTTP
jgi:glycosyltransferase involved in cell wall biosynthesis